MPTNKHMSLLSARKLRQFFLDQDFGFNELPVPAWVTDSSAEWFLALNREAQRVYGVSNDDASNIHVRDLILSWSHSEATPQNLASPANFHGVTQIHIGGDRRFFSVSASRSLIKKLGHDLLYWVLVPRDEDSNVIKTVNEFSDCVTAIDSSTKSISSDQKHNFSNLIEIFNEVSFAVAICNFNDGKWAYCNEAMRTIFGIKSGDWQGRTSIEMDLWEEPLERSKLMSLLVKHGKFSNVSAKLKNRNGYAVQSHVSACTFVSEGIKYTLASYHDLTALMNRLRASEANEALLSRALRGAASAVWEWDLINDTYQYVDRWEKLLGYSPGDLPHNSSTLNYLLHPDDAATVMSKLQAHFANFEPFTAEARLKTKAGVYRWFLVRGQAEKDLNGRAIRMSGTIDDTTENKLFDSERMRINERLALAIGAVALGTWEVFPDSSAVWDAQTYRLYGRDPATSVLPEVIFRESLSAKQVQISTQWLTDMMNQKSFCSIEFAVVWPDGQHRWLAAKGKSIRDASGRLVSLIGINWDITEQKRATLSLQSYQAELSSLNQRLMDQEKKISQDIAYSLHDQLGQTLTAIRLGIDTLRMQSLEHTSLSQQCAVLQALSEKAIQEVRDTLKQLRPPMLEELGLGRALESELLMVPSFTWMPKLQLIATQESLSKRWPQNIEYTFFMIAREAITNALKHARCRYINVTIEVKNEVLILEVCDDGVGFVQPTIKPRTHNLGLISMRERAQTIDAELILDSSSQVGTCVTLHWPKSL